MIDLVAQNPWRVPGWRWDYAKAVVQGDSGPPTAARLGAENAKWIRRAIRLSQYLRLAATDDNYRLSAAAELPELFWAYCVWQQQPGIPDSLRWSLEAHILARETNREIGNKVGCSERIVAAYEAVFFNVRDKLNYREYIMHTVLRDAVTRGVDARQYDLLWKLLGYLGGPHVLDAMIAQLTNPLACSTGHDVPAFFQDMAISAMKKQAAVAALTIPVNSRTQLALINAFVQYVEIERTSDSAALAQDQITANLSAMLNGLQFSVATEKNLPVTMDRGAVEFQADELLMQAAGLPIANLQELQELSFPALPGPAAMEPGRDENETVKQDGGEDNSGGKRGRRRARAARAEP